MSALIQALQDEDRYVRFAAVDALGSMGEEAVDAVPALIKVLKDQDARFVLLQHMH